MTCKEMRDRLEKLVNDLKKELQNSDPDLSEMYKKIVDITSKYPEEKELVEFVVIMHDYMMRDNKNIKNVLHEAIDLWLHYKIATLDKIEEVNNKKISTSTRIKSALNTVKQLILSKLVIPLGIVFGIFVLYLIFPDQCKDFFENILPKLGLILK